MTTRRIRNGWISATRDAPCPVCHRTRCGVSPDGTRVWCFRVESDSVRTNRLGAFLHVLADPPPGWTPPPAPPAEGKGAQRKQPDHLDKVYRKFLKRLSLARHHHEGLQARGLRNAEITRHGYRSLPARGKAAICRSMLAQLGDRALIGVPGFFWRTYNHGGGGWTFSSGHQDILGVPVEDADGRIQGLMLRRNNTDDRPDEDGPPKYWWFSSASKPKGNPNGTGASPGAPVHVARPKRPRDARIFITEGALKANIAAERLGAVVLGVAGVGQWRTVPEIIRTLGGKQAIVVITYDADQRYKPQVRHHSKALADALALAGHRVYQAVWDEVHGKGIDDLVVTGGAPSIEPWGHPLAPRSHVRRIPADMAVAEPDAPPEASDDVTAGAAFHRDHIWNALRAREGRHLLLDGTVGSAKTHGAADALTSVLTSGLQTRVCYVARNYEALAELAGRGGPLDRAGVTVAAGRQHPEHGPALPLVNATCQKFDLTSRLGNARQNVYHEACAGCAHNDEAPLGPRGSMVSLCPFLAHNKQTQRAQVVVTVAPKAVSEAGWLDDFDAVILDDCAESMFLERVSITRDDLDLWWSGMDRIAGKADLWGDLGDRPYSDTHPVRMVLQLLYDALRGQAKHPVDLLTELRAAAAENRIDDLNSLLTDCVALPTADEDGRRRHPFERPTDDDETIPLVAFRDLAEALHAEASGTADTRAWRTSDGVVLYLPRQHVLDVLRRKTVIVLDATPSPLLRDLFPKLEVVTFKPAAHLVVKQTHDIRLSRAYLHSHRWVQQAVERWLAEIAPAHGHVLVATFKDFDPAVVGPGWRLPQLPNIDVVHFGDATRAVNHFANYDAVVVLGAYTKNVWACEAEVRAFRSSPLPEDPPEGLADRQPVRFAGTDTAGAHYLREMPVHPDPMVQAVIAHSTEAEVIQAIGRLRAVWRQPDQPAAVYVLTGVPIDGLEGRIVDTRTLLGAPRHVLTLSFEAARDRLNAERAAAFQERFGAAIAQCEADGVRPSINRVQELTGAGRRHVVRALGEWRSNTAGGSHWTVLRNMREPVGTPSSVDAPTGLHRPTRDLPSGSSATVEGEGSDVRIPSRSPP